MQRMTAEDLVRLKMKFRSLPRVQLIRHRGDLDLGNADGKLVDGDTLRFVKEAANTLPVLIDEIERLHARLQEYRNALKPFAEFIPPMHGDKQTDDQIICTITAPDDNGEVKENVLTRGDFRRARELLAGGM